VIAPILLAAALAAPPSLAKLPAAGGGTVSIQAQRFVYSIPKKLIEYTGDPVRFTRGDSVLTCKRLDAQLDERGDVTRATCETDVRFERGDKILTCQKATYEAGTSKLTCEGSPAFQIGAVTGVGKLVVYDLAEDKVSVDEPAGKMPSAEADQAIEQAQQHKKAKGAKP
jgi:hypothetical protein